tara:strand:- start:157 stop:405 length:249 start_codon:yes stop_codon:yes gene_type:complete
VRFLKRFERSRQENPSVIAQELRRDFAKAPSLHSAINTFVVVLEEYAMRDKSRAGRYRDIAQRMRKIAIDIKDMIKDYEGKQ